MPTLSASLGTKFVIVGPAVKGSAAIGKNWVRYIFLSNAIQTPSLPNQIFMIILLKRHWCVVVNNTTPISIIGMRNGPKHVFQEIKSV